MIEVVLILAFAVYRITRFVVSDNLIDAQRWWVQKKLAQSDPPMIRDGMPAWRKKLLELLECPYCVSVWVTLAAGIPCCLFWSVPLYPITLLAAAGAAMVVWRVVEKD